MKRGKRVARDGFGGKRRSRSISTEGWRAPTEEIVVPVKRKNWISGDPGRYDPFADPLMGQIHRDDEDLLAILMAFLETR